MGFLSKTYERYITGEKREEDKTPMDRYLESIRWVDLGHDDFLFAMYDFPLNYLDESSELLSLVDLEHIQQNLPEGVYVLSKGLIKWIQDNCVVMRNVKRNTDITTSIVCASKITANEIHFNIDVCNKSKTSKYFLKKKDVVNNFQHIEINEIGPKKFPSYLGTTKEIPVGTTEEKTYMIKLVKLK